MVNYFSKEGGKTMEELTKKEIIAKYGKDENDTGSAELQVIGVTTMAKVRILNMMFYGFHGVYEYEREQGQKFFIDVEIETKDDKLVETDEIPRTSQIMASRA